MSQFYHHAVLSRIIKYRPRRNLTCQTKSQYLNAVQLGLSALLTLKQADIK